MAKTAALWEGAELVRYLMLQGFQGKGVAFLEDMAPLIQVCLRTTAAVHVTSQSHSPAFTDILRIACTSAALHDPDMQLVTRAARRLVVCFFLSCQRPS